MSALHSNTAVQVYGIIILIAGLAIRYFVNRRKFNRRNQFAVETFRTYEHKTFSFIFEKLLMYIAWPLILIGLFIFFMGWVSKKSVEKRIKEKQQTEVTTKK